MNQKQIFSILYDIVLNMGQEDEYYPLLTNTLQKIMGHTGFPCGMVLIGDNSSDQYTIAAAIGDYRLIKEIGTRVSVPEYLLSSCRKKVRGLPVKEN